MAVMWAYIINDDEAVARAAALIVAMHPREAAGGRFCRWD